jgi:hypothetical protein
MTSRAGWLLLGTALGIAGLPGCMLFPRLPDAPIPHDEVVDYTLPDDPMAVNRADAPPPPTVTGAFKAPAVAEPVGPTEPPSGKDVLSQKYPPEDPPKAAAVAEPPTKRAPLVEALQCVLDDRHQEALRHLQAYDAETQEFYLRVLPILTNFAKKRIDELSAQEVAVLNDQLQSVLATLRPRTELSIDRMCYCAWVHSYGVFQPLADGHAFVAPGPDRPGDLVRLYVELRNFANVPRGDRYQTRLSSAIEFRDAKGKRVDGFKFKDEKPYESLSRVNDFHNTYSFPVPDLPPGTYQIVLQITDETIPGTRRVAHKTLEFRVTPVGTRAR